MNAPVPQKVRPITIAILAMGGEGGGVIMRVTTETIKISTGAIDPSVFAVPGDYKLITKKR